MNKYTLFFVTLFVSLFVTLVTSKTSVYADGTVYGGYGGAPCVPVYGGGVQCPRPGELLLDKQVLNPATGSFVDNLGPNDPKYRPQGIVTFKVVVKNPGEQELSQVFVTDSLPQFVDFMSGPGSYDANTRKLTFTVTNLAGGATQTYEIKARVVHPGVLPEGKKIVCPVNVVEATTDGQSDRDESQFCIEKVMDVPQVPKAGPEHWVLSIAGLATTFVSGLYLRKRTSQLTISN